MKQFIFMAILVMTIIINATATAAIAANITTTAAITNTAINSGNTSAATNMATQKRYTTPTPPFKGENNAASAKRNNATAAQAGVNSYNQNPWYKETWFLAIRNVLIAVAIFAICFKICNRKK